MTADYVIGKNNAIPWHILGEQTRFKETTMGHSLIMGRKTFESIGHPLPGRRNLVVTRNNKYQAPGGEVFLSLDEALKACKGEKKVFVIGGQQLFTQSMAQADILILTFINRNVQGDTWFPKFTETDFMLVGREKITSPELYYINTYKRISPHV